MATRKCVNGHIYDPNVYGNNCPFCPSSETIKASAETKVDDSIRPQPARDTERTDGVIPTGPHPIGNLEPGGGTVIRSLHPENQDGNAALTRKLVALLVSYDTDSSGEVFCIYEGRNMIGRKSTLSISINDKMVSTEHLLILYREAEGVFWAIDNDSSNGTYVNGVFHNKVQLRNNDVIKIGDTKLIFMPIPRI